MTLAFAKPAEIALDSDRLNQAYQLLKKWTGDDSRKIPGGAIIVGRHGRITEPRFYGRMGMEPDAEPIRTDSMFLLASITKCFTYLAALKLVERGELSLTLPVTHYLPEFAAHHKEETLIHHLFTHTSGMPDMLADNTQLRREQQPLKRFIRGAIRDTLPLFKPGTSVSYQSMGTLVVAELIQQLSGKTIHNFIQDEILSPLAMNSAGLGSLGLKRDRIVRVEIPEYQIGSQFGWNSNYWQQFGAPWGGMFCSPEDLAVLCQCMLDGGVYRDIRLWSAQMIRVATTNRLNDYPELPEHFRRVQPWGLGWRMNHPGQPGSWGDSLDANVFGHTGATGTMVWMDRERNGFCILLTTAIRSRAPWRLVQLSNIIASAFK